MITDNTNIFVGESSIMENRLLITQALDERDLPVKRLRLKLQYFSRPDVKKNNEEKVLENSIGEEASFQKIWEFLRTIYSTTPN